MYHGLILDWNHGLCFKARFSIDGKITGYVKGVKKAWFYTPGNDVLGLVVVCRGVYKGYLIPKSSKCFIVNLGSIPEHDTKYFQGWKYTLP